MTTKRFAAALAALLGLVCVGVAGAQSPAPSASPSAKAARKLPARDPKTGRFMKASPAAPAMSGKKGGMMTGVKSAKKAPARDPKTGRFLKASPSPMASPVPKK